MGDLAIRAGYVAGIIGRVTELHAEYYGREWGFGAFFEAKVATEMSGFFERYDPDRDGTWSASADGRIQASITIDGLRAGGEGAHLRWFIASDAVRGTGIGARLMHQAMAFCRARGYPRVYLWTFRGLEPARRLYERAGFSLVESRAGTRWGSPVEEQRYEVIMAELEPGADPAR